MMKSYKQKLLPESTIEASACADMCTKPASNFHKKSQSLFFEGNCSLDKFTAKCKTYIHNNPLFAAKDASDLSFAGNALTNKMIWFERQFPGWNPEECEIQTKQTQKTVKFTQSSPNHQNFQFVDVNSHQNETNEEIYMIVDGNNFFWSKEIFRSLVLRNESVSKHVPFDCLIQNKNKFSNCQSILEKLCLYFFRTINHSQTKIPKFQLFFDGPLCVYDGANPSENDKFEKIWDPDTFEKTPICKENFFSITSALPNFKIADDAIFQAVKQYHEQTASGLRASRNVIVVTSDVGLKKRLIDLTQTQGHETRVSFMGSCHFLETVGSWAMESWKVVNKNIETKPLFRTFDDFLVNIDEVLF